MAKRRPPTKPSPPPPAEPVSRATLVLFAPAILVGAFLLFAIQPLIARYVLPWFGGAPAVWTTCMLFFQGLLLGGYLYAHLLVRYLPARGQIAVHLILLAGALAMIPIIPAARWKPTDPNDPVWRILLLLCATIGLPYFALSATSPLLQSWFVRVRPGASPYRLFALSNLGSLLALLAYPLVLEPLFTRRQQAWIWSAGLILFAVTCLACAAHVWRARRDQSPGSPTLPKGDRPEPKLAVQPILWIALPLVASVLLLAVTNTLTEDVAVTPLLWVVPLALYLLTFVIAFDSPRWYPRRAVMMLLPACTLWMLRVRCAPLLRYDVTLIEQFTCYLLAMFAICLFCHGELARIKPEPAGLTRYYLMISLGGVLGGAFVAIVAPRIFTRLFELPLGVFAAGVLAVLCFMRTKERIWARLFAATGALFIFGVPLLERSLTPANERIIARSRNFYGTLAVAESSITDPIEHRRLLNHGRISHGAQYQHPTRRHETTLYYREGSGVSFVLHHFRPTENRRVGLVGLGVGTLAAYAHPGDAFCFYEINPDVLRMAREQFTFLSDTAAATEVILGDARLTLEREQPQNFDILVLDAFSGDAIPTHLLTAEAFALYDQHLKPDGVIAVHFSNKSVDLGPLLLRQAHHLKMTTAVGNPAAGWWMLMTRNDAFLRTPQMRQGTQIIPTSDRAGLWTDDHVNLLQVIRWSHPST